MSRVSDYLANRERLVNRAAWNISFVGCLRETINNSFSSKKKKLFTKSIEMQFGICALTRLAYDIFTASPNLYVGNVFLTR